AGLDAAGEGAQFNFQLRHAERPAQRALDGGAAQDQFALAVDAHIGQLVDDADLLVGVVLLGGLDHGLGQGAGAQHGADAVVAVGLCGVGFAHGACPYVCQVCANSGLMPSTSISTSSPCRWTGYCASLQSP